MIVLLLLGGLALAVSLVLTPVVRNTTRRWGLVDHPDAVRKLHQRPVPRLGGVAIFLSYVVVFGLLKALGLQWPVLSLDGTPWSWLTIAAVLIVFGTGVIDDLVGLNAWQKLLGQVTAAVVAYASGVQIHSLDGHPVAMWWSLPLTVLWLIICSNAFNLIDGMDGLAAGLGFLATATMFIAAFVHHNTGLMILTLPLCGALLGFLRYNFNPASIFLGDCGSLTLGFLLGAFGVLSSDKSATLLGLTAPVMTLAVPLLDAAISVVRRFLRNQPVLSGDRRHVHHRLLDRGLTPRRAVLLLYGGGALAAAFSLLQNSMSDQFGGSVIVLFCVLACISIQYLGYVEFGTATRMVLNGHFRKVVDAEVRLRIFEERLDQTSSFVQCWDAICTSYGDFGLEGARLSAGGVVLEEVPSLENRYWQIRVPLHGDAYINFYSSFDRDPGPHLLSGFIRAVECGLKSKPFLMEEAPAVPVKGPQRSGIRVKEQTASSSA